METSIASLSYQSLLVTSNAALGVAGSRYFQQPNSVRQIVNPVLIAVAAKLLSLIPYYSGAGLEGQENHPYTGAGYPALFALGSGYVSNRIGNAVSAKSDLVTVALSSVFSMLHNFATNQLASKSLCPDYQNFNITTSDVKLSDELLSHLKGASVVVFAQTGHKLGRGSATYYEKIYSFLNIPSRLKGRNFKNFFDLNLVSGLGMITVPNAALKFKQIVHQNAIDSFVNKRFFKGEFKFNLATGVAMVVIPSIVSQFSDNTSRQFFSLVGGGLNALPFALGILLGSAHQFSRRRIFKILTSEILTMFTLAALQGLTKWSCHR